MANPKCFKQPTTFKKTAVLFKKNSLGVRWFCYWSGQPIRSQSCNACSTNKACFKLIACQTVGFKRYACFA